MQTFTSALLLWLRYRRELRANGWSFWGLYNATSQVWAKFLDQTLHPVQTTTSAPSPTQCFNRSELRVRW